MALDITYHRTESYYITYTDHIKHNGDASLKKKTSDTWLTMIAADPIDMNLGLKRTRVFMSIHNDNCT